MFTDNYRVVFESYSKHHHGAFLKKTYENRWSVAHGALTAQFARVDLLMLNRGGNCAVCRRKASGDCLCGSLQADGAVAVAQLLIAAV